MKDISMALDETQLSEETQRDIVKSIDASEEWERIPTSIPNVSIVKAPEYNGHQPVMMELAVTDKKRIYLKNEDELKKLWNTLYDYDLHLTLLLNFIDKNYNKKTEQVEIHLEAKK